MNAAAGVRFGVMLYPDRDFEVLVRRARLLEDLGFDTIYLPDHSGDLRDRGGPWLDSFTALSALALATERVRLGTMVANQILRPPAQLARQAVSADHLSGGRFELGIGAGLFDWDHHSVGQTPWSPRDRMRRLRDYVAIVDGLLRADRPFFDYTGEHLWVRSVATAPGSRQRPRLPLTLGGQSPSILRIVAERGDAWNTHGPPGASAAETLAATERQCARLDALAVAAGRDPAAIRRSYTLFGPWDPRRGGCTYAEVFDRFGALGITEFVLDWPGDRHLAEFERTALHTLPAYRNSAR